MTAVIDAVLGKTDLDELFKASIFGAPKPTFLGWVQPSRELVLGSTGPEELEQTPYTASGTPVFLERWCHPRSPIERGRQTWKFRTCETISVKSGTGGTGDAFSTLFLVLRDQTRHVEDLFWNASKEDANYWKTKSKLEELLRRFVTKPFSWFSDAGSPVNSASADAAIDFLRMLPLDRELPTVAPDGEGDVVLAWERQEPNVIVTVEPTKLHAVIGPTSASPRHLDDVPFDRTSLPEAILHLLPKR